MMFDDVCYYVIHLCRVILYVWRSPFIVSLFLASTLLYLRVLLSPGVYRRLCLPFNATPMIVNNSIIFPRLSALPFGERVLTYTYRSTITIWNVKPNGKSPGGWILHGRVDALRGVGAAGST